MPSKVRDTSPERRRVSSKNDSPKAEKSEKRERTRTSHRKASTRDRTTSKASLSPSRSHRRSSMPNIAEHEKGDALQPSESKANFPYPSFSKEHSKEAVGSREAARPNLNILTPPATDLNASKEKIATFGGHSSRDAPPSPPLTDQNAGKRQTGVGRQAEVETIVEEDRKSLQDSKEKKKLRSKPSRSDRLRSSSEVGSTPLSKPRSRERPAITPVKTTEKTIPSSHRTVSQPLRSFSPAVHAAATDIADNTSSDETSIAPEQPSVQRPGSRILPGTFPAVFQDDILSQVTSIQGDSSRKPTPLEVFVESAPRSTASTPADCGPPPPPPPPIVPINVPRVDYLLQNGGLNTTVPKTFLHAGKPMAIQQAPLSLGQPPVVVAHLFEPFNQLLEDFQKVMCKNGSLAVATGYRSVARRLLDRLEAVFARDISSEACECCMCAHQAQEQADWSGVSWGEILELVAGRRDLPNWPPFAFVASPVGLGIALETHIPMQKLDIDVPEEYREHYIRQSRKTKQSVDKWLGRQTDSPSSPPEEVDDETLTFAILTHLPPEHRQTLTNLLGIVQGPTEPPRRAPSPDRDTSIKFPPTPQPRARPEPIVRAGHAIQRLYRLGQPPRDPETAIFMLNNPTLHNALATLAAISNDEWEILISGRFDGFLRSGAEDMVEPANGQGRYTPFKAPSRGPTPLRANGTNGHSRQSSHPSRGTTPANVPAQYGAPVAFDEETEIATLAEIERDIYTGMEALEDAFEALHVKAEMVRQALRDRNAGLTMAAQRRKGSMYGGVEVRGATPTSANGLLNGLDQWEAETDDGLGDWDGVSELAPDDSASNISSSRRRRPRRRNERRTPVVGGIAEDDESESYAESEGTASPKKDGRRR